MTTSSMVQIPFVMSITLTRQQEKLNVVDESACNYSSPTWKPTSCITMVTKMPRIASWVTMGVTKEVKSIGLMGCVLSQPHFEGVWRWHSHSWNVNFGVLWDSQILRARLQGSKHLALNYSLYRWKGLEVQMSKMASHVLFRHLKHKLWTKEGSRVKLPVWLPTTKNRESTQF
jgi:hypothetical protein